MLQIDGVIRKNPATTVDFPKRWKTLPRFLSADEALKLLDGNSTVRNHVILELLYGSGIRVSELVDARLDGLDMERRVLRVHGKGDKERDVPLSGPTVCLLREYLAGRRSCSRYIFVSESNGRGRPSDQLSREWIWHLVRKHAKAAGLGKVRSRTPSAIPAQRHCSKQTG